MLNIYCIYILYIYAIFKFIFKLNAHPSYAKVTVTVSVAVVEPF